MALFAKDAQASEAKLDVPGAEAFKQEHEAAILSKEAEAEALTGKDNKKARTEVGKLVAAMKADPKYVDACKVAKGLLPPNGNFTIGGSPNMEFEKVAATPAAVAPEKDTKAKEAKVSKPKKVESTGLSKGERDELEKLKGDIIARKAELKAAGKSGGECNKDEQVVAWVDRMNELKIKEDPSAADVGKGKDAAKPKEKKKGAMSSTHQADLEKMKAELETYRQQLIKEFGYSKKDIANDPEFIEKESAIKAQESRS